jgi:hypothetical protein
VATQATLSRPIAEVVVLSNDFAKRREQATVRDLDAPGLPNGAEDRLLVVPPDPADLEVCGVGRGCEQPPR